MLHAASAEAAMVLAVQQPLSLITLDIMLPNMDGWEFLGRIKQVPALDAHPGRDHLDRGRSQPGLRARRRGDHAEADVAAGAVRGARRARAVAAGARARRSRSWSSTTTRMRWSWSPSASRAWPARCCAPTAAARRSTSRGSELPDLIVLDLMMPEVSGFDVVEALSEHPDTARIPDPDRHRQADHRRGPGQAERLRDDDHGEGRVQPRALRRRSPAGHVGPPGRWPDMARILIVEDNADNMLLTVLLLESAGHTVLSAVDAEAGLALARDERPDLILMDIQLPGMDGLEATALLKADAATRAHSGDRADRAGDEGRRRAHPRRRL